MPEVNWKDFLGLDNDKVEELRVIGYAYVRQGKYDIARKIFEAINVFEPGNVTDIETIGALYLQLGDATEALIHLEKALSMKPDSQNALLNKAKAFFTLGQKENGLSLAKKLKKSKNKLISDQATALTLAHGGL